jgi:N-acetylmuramic acid 6-phosphate etherase
MSHSSKWQSLPTEAINPSTLAIDKQPATGVVDLMLAEDRKVLAAVQRERDRIAVGADMLAKALGKGGRVIFVGAGTSGRLGVVEAAEMPPTFGTDPDLVQAIMAGGKTAFLRAKEGAEDDYEEGARATKRLTPGKRDVVVGVSASGMTPFVRGALTCARGAGARRLSRSDAHPGRPAPCRARPRHPRHPRGSGPPRPAPARRASGG